MPQPDEIDFIHNAIWMSSMTAARLKDRPAARACAHADPARRRRGRAARRHRSLDGDERRQCRLSDARLRRRAYQGDHQAVVELIRSFPRKRGAPRRRASAASAPGLPQCDADLYVLPLSSSNGASPARAAASSRSTRPELGHSDHESERGALADASHALYQVAPASEIVVRRAASATMRSDLGLHGEPCRRATSARTRRRNRGSLICSSRTLRRAMSSSVCSMKVRCRRARPSARSGSVLGCSMHGRTGGDQHSRRARRSWRGAGAGGKGRHLDRLQHENGEAGRRADMRRHRARSRRSPRCRCATTPALRQVGCAAGASPAAYWRLASIRSRAMNRDVELGLGCIDPCRRRASLLSSSSTLPCEANQVVPSTIRVR